MDRHLSNQVWKISIRDDLSVGVTDHVLDLCVYIQATHTYINDMRVWITSLKLTVFRYELKTVLFRS